MPYSHRITISFLTSPSSYTNVNDKYGGVLRSTYYRNKRKRAYHEIEVQGDIALWACANYFANGLRCVVMAYSRGVSYASYRERGVACVDSFWASLDKTREETKSRIDKDLEELEKITARLARNRKILKLAKARAKAKAICLLDELEEEEELERMKNGGSSNSEIRGA
jgi:hypothetical protein